MPNCDVCNETVSSASGTVYTGDEFRFLVRQGYSPPAAVQSMMAAMGMPLSQWKDGLVANSTTPWMLCPSCAHEAKKIIPRSAGQSQDALIGQQLNEILTPEMLGLLSQVKQASATSASDAAPTTMVECPCCGLQKKKDDNPCPHCGFFEWSLVIGFGMVAIGVGCAILFWFENTYWLIGSWVVCAVFSLLGLYASINNLRVSRKQKRGEEEPEPEWDATPRRKKKRKKEIAPTPKQQSETETLSDQESNPSEARFERKMQVVRRKLFDCHGKSYEGTAHLAVSPDGHILASAGGSSGGDICLVDLSSGEQIATLEAHADDGVTALGISPDSRRLVSAGDSEGDIRIWSLPDGALIHKLSGNSTDTQALTISPDGRLLASSGGGDNAIRLWKINDGTEFKILKAHADKVTKLGFTPDGKYLISADDKAVLRIWNIPEGEMLARCRTDRGNGTVSMAISPDGRYVADGEHTWVRVWSIPDGELLCSVQEDFWIYGMAISPDAKLLAASGSSSSGRIRVWNMPDGSGMRELVGHKDENKCLAISPDGRFLASGNKDQDVILWSLPDGGRLATLEDHPGHITSLVITPDSRTVVVGSKDGSVTLWSCAFEGEELPAQASKGAEKSTADDQLMIISCKHCKKKLRCKSSFAGKKIRCPQCKEILTIPKPPAKTPSASKPTIPAQPTPPTAIVRPGKRSVQARRRKQIDRHSKSYEGTKQLAIAPSGKWLASAGGSSDGDICLFDLASNEQIANLEAHTYYGVTALVFGPDSSRLISTGDNNDGKVRVWSMPDGAMIHDLEGNSFDNRTLAVTPDGSLLASSGGGDNGIRLWNLADGTLIKTLKGHGDDVKKVAVTSYGQYLVSGDGDGVVRIWRLPDGEMLVRCRTDKGNGIASLVVSPDGQFAADGAHTDVRLWSIPDGGLLTTLKSGISWIYGLAISADSRYLAATGNGTKSVYLWNVPDGKLVKQLEGHTNMDLNCVAFSPDCAFLASGGKDQDVRLWNPYDGAELTILEDHPGHITSLAISADSRIVAVGSKDGSVTLWDVEIAG